MGRVLGGNQREEPMQPDLEQPPSDADNLGGDAFGVQPGEGSSGGWDDPGATTNTEPDDNLNTGDSDGGWDDSSGGGGDTDV